MKQQALNRRLLIIAPPGSYRLNPYLKAARKLNLLPVIASTSTHSILPFALEGLHLDMRNPAQALQRILEYADKHNIIGIIGADDLTVELAAEAASKLGLAHNPASATRLSQRKDLARQHLSSSALNIPWHQKIELDNLPDLQQFTYPLVVKPLSLSGSRGVIRANNPLELQQAIDMDRVIIQDSYDEETKSQLLLEAYIEGQEIALEALLADDQLTTLAIFDKPDPLQGPYFEETYYITPSRLTPSIQERCQQAVLTACQHLGLKSGPIHAELRIDADGQPWILEVAARTIGGDCSQSLKPSAEYSLEELVISYAIGEPIKPEPQQHSSGVLMIPVPKAGILKRVEGILEAEKVKYITALTIDIPAGNEVQCLPEASSYLGFIFAEADKPEQVEAALRAAHEKLSFIINPIWKIGGDINF